MYDFSSKLLGEEKILWQGQAVPGKGDRSIGGLIVYLVVCLGMWALFLLPADYEWKGELGWWIMFFIMGLFVFIGIYCICNQLWLKDKHIKGRSYCLTNMRAMSYDSKKDALLIGYLENFDIIMTDNVAGGYGDLVFSRDFDKGTLDSREAGLNFAKAVVQRDFNNIHTISFSSIQHPGKVKKMAKEAKKELMQSAKQQISNNGNV